MTEPFLALITPIGASGGAPQPPLGIWGPTDPGPTHPIAGYPWLANAAATATRYLGADRPTSDATDRDARTTTRHLGARTDPRPGWGLPTPQPPGGSLAAVCGCWSAAVYHAVAGHPSCSRQSWTRSIHRRGYIVAYMPSEGGYERITFTVEIPPPTTPTEPAFKGLMSYVAWRGITAHVQVFPLTTALIALRAGTKMRGKLGVV